MCNVDVEQHQRLKINSNLTNGASFFCGHDVMVTIAMVEYPPVAGGFVAWMGGFFHLAREMNEG